MVGDGLPTDQQGYDERIHEIKLECQRLRETTDGRLPSSSEENQVRQLYNRLRATVERAVEQKVFGGVMRRFDDEVKVGKLHDLLRLSDHQIHEFEKLHKKCSGVVSSHDPSAFRNAPVPSVQELQADICGLEQLVKSLSNSKSTQ